jgi:hypothetical protein
VGIATAGVQASIKLYALAEKISTASQRVSTIANDISSTCGILNQVRELLLPQPDAQGICRSVFSTNSLSDISHAFRSCKSVFTEIEILLHRASEQVEKRSTTHSKIELSGFEKAKWPFLQPQFDDLRTELRDTKLNLMSMIAVATLALANRGWLQRPMHDRERLELGSSIAQFQRARTIKPRDQGGSVNTHSQKWSVLKLFGKRPSSVKNGHREFKQIRDNSHEQISGSRNLDATETFPPLPPPPPLQNVDSLALPDGQICKVSPYHSNLSKPDPSEVTNGDGALALHAEADDPRAHGQPRETPWTQDSCSREPSKLSEQQNVDSSQEELAVEPDSSLNTAQLTPFIALEAFENRPISTLPATTPTASSPFHDRCHYQGWTTDYLQGLMTGHGNSVSLRRMELSDRSLEKLVKIYTDEGHDPHIVMFELTTEQQRVIKQTCLGHPEAEVVYVRLERNITVPSVFGTLTIETLKWIVSSEVAWSPTSRSNHSLGEMFFRDRVEGSVRYSPIRRYASMPESERPVSGVTEQQGVSWRTRILRAIRYPKVKQEADHIVPYRVVQRNRTSARRRVSRRSRDAERRYSRTEIVRDSSPQSAIHSEAPSLHQNQTAAIHGKSGLKPYDPTVTEEEGDIDLVGLHYSGEGEPKSSRRSSRPGVSFSRQRLPDSDEDIVNELLAKWTI